MTFLIETLTFTTNAGTGNQAITLDSGIWAGATGADGPQVVIFSSVGATVDGVSVHALMGFGVGISASSRAGIASQSQNGVSTSNADRRHDNAGCFTLLDTAGAVWLAFDFVSFTANTMTINIMTGLAVEVNATVIGGTDVEAALLEFANTTAGSTENIAHGMANTPNAGVMLGVQFATTPAATTTAAITHIGLTDFAGGDRSVFAASQNGVGTSNTQRTLQSNLTHSTSESTGTQAWTATATADGTNVAMTYSTTPSAAEYHWLLCLKVPAVAVEVITQPATNSTVSTDVGFSPAGGLFLSHMGRGTGYSDDVPAAIGAGKSFRFDGENDYVRRSSISGIASAAKVTIAFWGKKLASGVAGGVLNVGCDSGVSDFCTLYWYTDGKVYVDVRSNSGSYGTYVMSHDTNWHFFMMVYDGTQAVNADRTTLYVDGVDVSLTDAGTYPASLSATCGDQVTLGKLSTNANELAGLIDDARIYSAALTAGNEEWLRTNGASGDDPTTANLQAYWKFDGDLLDDTANNNDLTQYGEVNEHARLMIGQWSDGSGQNCVGTVDEDGQSTSDADRLQDSNEAIKLINHAQTVVGSGTASVNGNAVDIVFTNSDTTQREIVGLIFGAAAGTSIPIFAYHYNHNIGANI